MSKQKEEIFITKTVPESYNFIDRISIPKSHDYKLKDQKQFEFNHINKSIHTFDTIKWLKRKVGNENVKKSIMTLLPNNGKVEENEDNKLSMFLENYLKDYKSQKELILNPNYMFSNETITKILILRDIFLEFDEDGSRKLELTEMEEMFISNNIFTEKKELAGLFFPNLELEKDQIIVDVDKVNDKKVRLKNDKNKLRIKKAEDKLDNLYLDFFQFMMFGISPVSDQNFRNFIRRIRENVIGADNHFLNTLKRKNSFDAIQKNKMFIKLNQNSDNFHVRNFSNEKKKEMDKIQKIMKGEITHFLPMNFNLLLDYFNKNRKVREWNKEIKLSLVIF